MKTRPLGFHFDSGAQRQRWISSTIQSALAQTWPSKEIIIVDDGSSEETLAIAGSFESKGVAVVSHHRHTLFSSGWAHLSTV